jgi:hypothetical protein
LRLFAKPEDTFQDAQTALDKAHAKFDAASAHASTEQGKERSGIQALSDIIAEKQERATALAELAKSAASIRDLLAGIK